MIDYQYISEEYVKCYSDKSRIYMIEHYLKTYDATQRREVPYNLFPRQKVLCRTMGNANNVVLTKPRQAGCTTTAGGFISCEMVLADKESPQTVLVIGNTLDLAQQMLFKIRDFLLQFPLWMWGDTEEYIKLGYDITKPPYNKKVIFEVCNSKELLLKNGCKVVARSSGPDASRGVGGVTWLLFDEMAFIENGTDVYASAIPTVSTGGHIIGISTPNGLDKLYSQIVKKAQLKGTADWNNFELVEMYWYQDPRYNKHLEWLRKNDETGEYDIIKEKTLDDTGTIEYNEEHWKQMIADGWKPRSPWYVKMCQQFNNDPQKIAQELDVSFLGSDSTVVAPEYIQMQRDLNVREPNPDLKDVVLEDTWVWKAPIPGHRYIMSCLPTGEKVLTDSGLKNIENVSLNDKLVNKEGNFVKINTIKEHFVENETMVDFKMCNMYNHVKFTWNHPIWSSINTKIVRRKSDNYQRTRLFNWTFNNAIDIKSGDWIMIPNVYKNNILTEKEILKHWEPYEDKTRIDFKIENPLLSEEFWWFCGMWLAEGWCMKKPNNSYTVYTTHNITEIEIINKVKNIANKLFNRNTHQKFYKDNNGTTLQFNSTQISNFLCDTFGKYAKNKQVPEWVKFLPEHLKIQLLNGYFQGDGCVTHNCMYIVSISKKLLIDVQDMLFSIGIISGLFLSSKEKYVYITNHKKISHCQEKYTLNCGKYDTKLFLEKTGAESNYESKFSRRIISNTYFSDDMNYIYVQIKGKEIYKYTGNVHNFDCETHTFCGEKIATHNCDNSRGSADDFTALEITDLDGIDYDGTPCIEQVLEYNGKLTGDNIGEIAYQYAVQYNNAFVVVEDIGGYGSATITTLQRLNYKNLYYDDPNLKKYTSQNDASSTQVTENGWPGFHSTSVRFQMLSNFADMVKSNQYKIRSSRVCNELDTWVFVPGSRGMDHKDGCHDDTITCLAMAMFVFKFSLNRQTMQKERDKQMLEAMVQANSRIVFSPGGNRQNTPNNNAPDINQVIMTKKVKDATDNPYMWLFR